MGPSVTTADYQVQPGWRYSGLTSRNRLNNNWNTSLSSQHHSLARDNRHCLPITIDNIMITGSDRDQNRRPDVVDSWYKVYKNEQTVTENFEIMSFGYPKKRSKAGKPTDLTKCHGRVSHISTVIVHCHWLRRHNMNCLGQVARAVSTVLSTTASDWNSIVDGSLSLSQYNIH